MKVENVLRINHGMNTCLVINEVGRNIYYFLILSASVVSITKILSSSARK